MISVFSHLSTWEKTLIIIGSVIVVSAPFLFAPAKTTPQPPGEVPPQEGGFPVPPMDLTVPPSPRLRRLPVEREPAQVGVGSEFAGASSPVGESSESEV